ncbi:MAG TPA: hypothetical protein PLW65_25715 [Pseudomonadota bacterium]|nr:hypothetical protein [Pseudomonadota bacterium]
MLLPGETITPLPPRRTVPQTADGYELTPNAEVWAMLLDPGCTNAWTPVRYTIYSMTVRLEINDGERRCAQPDQVYFSKKAAELEAARREEEWRRKNRDIGQYGPGPA